ncbi:UNVERIFIED_CONTAM: hypothetical protein GTU68_005085 [Idotea baltica]|nr:hypothetical protein [Idotea baltica]
MRKKTAYTIGVEAEQKIAGHYISSGHQIIFERYKTKYGEIDLIAKKDSQIVFIEVKARNNPMHLELLSQNQISRNCNAALIFLAENEGFSNCDLRFDYAEIINGKISQVIENAWVCEA